MMPQSPLRAIFSLFIGMFAGISLTTGILPPVVTSLFEFTSVETMVAIREFILPVIILWAICGAWLGWQGGVRTGGLVLGGCGAISGLFLGMFVFAGLLPIVVICMLTGFIYGGLGGLILGRVFPKPEYSTVAPSAE